ncbi:MAG: DUF2155 domain-containing protein [Hyphomonadaceae bacterium]
MTFVRAALCAAFLSLAPATAFADTVVLRVLDKTSGAARDIGAPVGRAVSFETLRITARACQKKPPEDVPEVKAYLEIDDRPLIDAGQPKAAETMIFSGWMFASSPALNALEHPTYDVWVIDCRS